MALLATDWQRSNRKRPNKANNARPRHQSRADVRFRRIPIIAIRRRTCSSSFSIVLDTFRRTTVGASTFTQRAFRAVSRTGGGTPSSTRSTSAASPTATATGSATWPASAAGCPTSPSSASTRSGSRRSTPRRWPTTATTWPTPRDVDPLFGDLAEFDALLAEAHELGIRVTIDLVPNHSSHDHEWFQAALAAAPGSPERARYLFRDGRGPDGERAAEQLAVGLRRPGVDPGARRAVVPAPVRPRAARPGLHQPRGRRRPRGRSCASGWTAASTASGSTSPTAWPSPRDCRTWCRPRTPACSPTTAPGDLRFDQDGVHEVHRRIRARARRVPRDRMAVGEVWVADDERLAHYLRADELHLAFNFKLLAGRLGRRRAPRRRSSTRWPRSRGTPAPACWVLSNHDRPRHVTRYGGGELGTAPGAGRRAAAAGAARRGLRLQRRRARPARRRPARRGAAGPDLGAVGAHRARPGRLPGAHAVVGRRSRRTGSPPAPDTWLPMPAGWAPLTVEAQAADAGVDAVAVPSGAGAAARRRRPSPARRCSGCRHPTAAWRSAVPVAWSAWSTSPPRRAAAGESRFLSFRP